MPKIKAGAKPKLLSALLCQHFLTDRNGHGSMFSLVRTVDIRVGPEGTTRVPRIWCVFVLTNMVGEYDAHLKLVMRGSRRPLRELQASLEAKKAPEGLTTFAVNVENLDIEPGELVFRLSLDGKKVGETSLFANALEE